MDKFMQEPPLLSDNYYIFCTNFGAFLYENSFLQIYKKGNGPDLPRVEFIAAQ